MPEQQERSGVDRRVTRTDNCDIHEDRMDKIDADINRGKGWFQAVCGICGVAIMLVAFIGSSINTKLTNIESMLGTDKSDIRILNEQMKNVQQDIKDIQDRHKEHDRLSYRGVTK